MDPKVKTLLVSGAELTDRALERLLPSPDTLPHSIHRAMRHSVFAGGKRLRPILAMESARMVSGSTTIPQGAADLGAALEMIHTYSLIHDDLPALDNDDLRRGQPTCHVVFGEATAILAGDALQTLAFQTISQLPAPPATIVAILKDISLAIGTGVGRVGDLETALPPGMIGGQVVDIESEGRRQSGGPNGSGETTRKAPTAELVESIHRAKTGALITTSIVSGGLFGIRQMRGSMGLAGGTDRRGSESLSAAKARLDALQKGLEEHRAVFADTIARLRTFGEKAGLAFQIVDDVLDMTQSSEELGKTAGKDTATTKATWPAVFGIEKSLKDAEELIADAFAALEPFGAAAAHLKSLAQYLVERKN
jgi:geranylgeranyl diphosphate synthase type II